MTQNSGNQRSNPNNPVHHQHYQNHLRQDFDDDVERAGSNERVESKPAQKDFRVLKCFCGCSQLTYDQIESYAMMSVSGIMHNEDSRKLLRTFLSIGHLSDKSNATIQLECVEVCERILGDLDSYQEHLDALFEVCPSFLWEQKINDACEVNQEVLQEVLTALKKECLNNIECDQDWTRFRRELLRKIGK